MYVPDTYPTEPPEFVAPRVRNKVGEEAFLHFNIQEDGHVCMEANQVKENHGQYHEKTTLTDMLQGLQSLIYEPNKLSAYPGALFEACKEGNHREYELMEAQAELLEVNSEAEDNDSENEDGDENEEDN